MKYVQKILDDKNVSCSTQMFFDTEYSGIYPLFFPSQFYIICIEHCPISELLTISRDRKLLCSQIAHSKIIMKDSIFTLSLVLSIIKGL